MSDAHSHRPPADSATFDPSRIDEPLRSCLPAWQSDRDVPDLAPGVLRAWQIERATKPATRRWSHAGWAALAAGLLVAASQLPGVMNGPNGPAIADVPDSPAPTIPTPTIPTATSDDAPLVANAEPPAPAPAPPIG
ncbi:MAG: hypothetical protein AAF907_02750, partial [Planctomycetota bacterium]